MVVGTDAAAKFRYKRAARSVEEPRSRRKSIDVVQEKEEEKKCEKIGNPFARLKGKEIARSDEVEGIEKRPDAARKRSGRVTENTKGGYTSHLQPEELKGVRLEGKL